MIGLGPRRSFESVVDELSEGFSSGTVSLSREPEPQHRSSLVETPQPRAQIQSKSYPIPKSMLDTISATAAIVGASAIVGPGADTTLVLPVWAGMIVKLSSQAGSDIDDQTAERLSMVTLACAGTLVGEARIGFASALAPVWWTVLPVAGVRYSALNARLTSAFGRAAARYLLQTRKIEDVDDAAKQLITLVVAELGTPT